MEKKISLLVLCFCLLPAAVQAQRYYINPIEVGILAAITNYSGDLAEHNIEPNETRFGYGGYVRYYLDPKFAVKAHLYSGIITGDDKHNPDLAFRKFRYTSKIFEIGAVGEWHVLGEPRISNTGVFRFSITPYLFGGVGYAFSHPEAECYGNRDECEKVLRERFPELDQQTRFFTMPVGGGIRLDIAERLVLSSEIGWRPVFSDRLDGISINANPKKGDWYYFFGTSLAYVLNNPYRFRRRF